MINNNNNNNNSNNNNSDSNSTFVVILICYNRYCVNNGAHAVCSRLLILMSTDKVQKLMRTLTPAFSS